MIYNLLPIKYQIDSQISLLNNKRIINLYVYNDDISEHDIKKVVHNFNLIGQNKSIGSEIQNLSCYGCGQKDLDKEVIVSDLNMLSIPIITNITKIEGFANINNSMLYMYLLVFIIIILLFHFC